MSDLLSNVVVPIASQEDALTTANAAVPRIADVDGTVTAVYVVEKAGGAPDKAPMEALEEAAEEAFDVFGEYCATADVPFESSITYNTSVPDGVFEVANEVDASAVVFTPRKSGRITRLLSGDTALKMITKNDRPIVVLPDEPE